jgi:hypothetical protein
MSTQASDLARRLAEQAETVCRHYLSKGRRTGRYWIIGDVRNTLPVSRKQRVRQAETGSTIALLQMRRDARASAS